MINFFKGLFGGSVPEASLASLGADMHSHILPGLDDGSENLEQSLELVREMQALGYRKLIMTPHVMSDFYKNTPEGIRERLAVLQKAVSQAGIQMELGCAAEHYLDEGLLEKLEKKQELLTFGNNYLLFETSFLNEPLNLKQAVFQMRSQGYRPVLAHPERYTYFHGKFKDLATLREMGTLFQVNLNSLTGYYSDQAKHTAEKLIDEKMVDFLGSDAHNMKHVGALQRVLKTKYIHKALALPLLNPNL